MSHSIICGRMGESTIGGARKPYRLDVLRNCCECVLGCVRRSCQVLECETDLEVATIIGHPCSW